MIFAALIALLTGFDLYVSRKRMKTYGPQAEFNPLARYIAREVGINQSLLFLAIYNLLLITLWIRYDVVMHIWFGAKLSLAALQLKGLQTCPS